MKWNEVTWYSKWGAIILFLVIVPALSFYIGEQYQEVKGLQTIDVVVNNEISLPKVNSNSKEKLLTVLSPNGGETLSLGQTIKIKWLSPGGGVVAIQLNTIDAKNSTGCPGYEAGIPGKIYDCRYIPLVDDTNNKEADWLVGKTLDGSIIPPGNYYLRIYYSEIGMSNADIMRSEGFNLEDFSDSYFTIK